MGRVGRKRLSEGLRRKSGRRELQAEGIARARPRGSKELGMTQCTKVAGGHGRVGSRPLAPEGGGKAGSTRQALAG